MGCPRGIKVDASGNVWIADAEHNRIEEFSATGGFLAAYGSKGSGEGQFEEPTGLAFSGGNVYVVDEDNHRIEELSTAGKFIRQFGETGTGSGDFMEAADIAVDPAGNLYVIDAVQDRVQEFSATGTFLAKFGLGGTGEEQLNRPVGLTINAAGSAYLVDSDNNRIEQWTPISAAVHDTQTIYYTAAANSEHTNCGGHPEWTALPCQTQPAAQPEVGPSLPVSTYTYNIWEENEKTTETFGATTRTKAETYDPAGRALTSETTSTIDEPLGKVTNEYNKETGALVKQSTEAKGKTENITSKYNPLGQLTEYTDAAGNVAKYTYDIDGRITEHSEGKGEEAKSSQTYTYDPTTGDLTKLVDSGVGTFTAEYDVEGKMLAEKYPNGLNANYTYSTTGQATNLEYVKTTHCTEKCTWLSARVTPSIHGETLAQTSTLATERYTYDKAGRLTETQEEPAGKPCTTRLYTYDEESNRTSLTAREGAEGKCPTEGGTVQRHTYDQANRLTDTGTSYETFGNTTQLPTADAGKTEITSTYFVDSQLTTEKQNSETVSYSYDPEGRTLETIAEGPTESTTTSHYAGAGEGVTWTAEGTGAWTRNIPGIDGSLSATQTSSGTKTLQLRDLQGDIVATASTSETETKLLSTYNSTEFGVPQPGTTPPKYAWLGANDLATEAGLASGVANPGGSSYVPLIGRALQTQAVASPGSFPDGTGYAGVVQASYLPTAANSIKQLAVEHEAELEEASRRQAEEAAMPEQCLASECGPWPGGGNLPLPGEGGAEETILETAFESGGGAATAAMLKGSREFSVTFERTASQALGLARAIEIIASGENPAAVAGLHGLPSLAYQALLRAFEGKLVGSLQGAAKNLREAAEFAEGPITIVLHGYLHGYWQFEVIFTTSVGLDDE